MRRLFAEREVKSWQAERAAKSKRMEHQLALFERLVRAFERNATAMETIAAELRRPKVRR